MFCDLEFEIFVVSISLTSVLIFLSFINRFTLNTPILVAHITTLYSILTT